MKSVCLRLIVTLTIWAGAMPAPAQTPARFLLEIPGSNAGIFEGDVIELPVFRLDRLMIHILDPLASSIPYSRIFPRVNGRAAAVISQIRTVEKGKVVELDLRLRPDITLSPGTNVVEITAVNERGRKFYRNWVLRLREQARNEWFSYEFLRQPGGGETAPDIEILEPDHPVLLPAKASSTRVRLRFRVASLYPLVSVQAGGRSLPLPPSAQEAACDDTLEIRPNQSEIPLEAVDSKGNRTRVRIPLLSGRPSVPVKASGERLAILIGLSRHRHSSVLPCKAETAAADASALASLLVSGAGFPPDKVILLVDEQATLANIQNALRFHSPGAASEASLLLYWAGCAIHDPADPEKVFLTAYDSQPGVLSETALPLASLERMLREQPGAARGVLVFDVTPADERELGAGASSVASAKLLDLASERHTVIVSAQPRQQQARLRNAEGRLGGLFAGWLREGLAGGADWNQDKLITTAELFRYVSTRVRDTSGGSQTPVYRLNSGELVLARLEGR